MRVAKRLTRRAATPLLVGLNPTAHSKKFIEIQNRRNITANKHNGTISLLPKDIGLSEVFAPGSRPSKMRIGNVERLFEIYGPIA